MIWGQYNFEKQPIERHSKYIRNTLVGGSVGLMNENCYKPGLFYCGKCAARVPFTYIYTCYIWPVVAAQETDGVLKKTRIYDT